VEGCEYNEAAGWRGLDGAVGNLLSISVRKCSAPTLSVSVNTNNRIVGPGYDAAGVRLGHDHGSQCLSDDFQAEIAFLGMESSPSFVRQPECNGCVERFIRTLREQLLWVRRFRDVEEPRQALAELRERYNQRWVVERLGYLAQQQARQQLLAQGAAA
jgi:transposase InsO family protein